MARRCTWLTPEQKVALTASFDDKVAAMPTFPEDDELKPVQNALYQTLGEWRAAVKIQAAFRAWRWRKVCLWNPHDKIGAKHLALTAKRHCCR